MTTLQVFLFGPPRLEREGAGLPVNRRKMLALLAYLLVTRQPHSREALATLFWPDFDTSSALANLRRDLSRLKELLGDGCLLIEREKVQVDPQAALRVDVALFEDCIRQVEEHGHFQPGEAETPYCDACRNLLEEAAQVYTDGFMAGFNLPDSPAFDDWQFYETERLRGLLSTALLRLAQWRIAQGAYEEAIPCARRWLALDPLHEPAQRLVMQLFTWAGQPTAALRQYQGLVELLDRELGVEPEEETTALYETIRARRSLPPPHPPPAPQAKPLWQQASNDEPHHTLSGPATVGRVTRLPAQTTPLIGRQAELAQLLNLLSDPGCRLVSLIGTGGIGKTRLAVETAARAEGQFIHGAVFVPLASVGEPGLIVAAIANAMQVRFSPGSEPREQLLQRLSGMRVLLVLDNFDHLLDGAGLVGEILAAAPEVRVLATSRERLNLVEEWIFEVDGLAYPRQDETAPEEAAAEAGEWVEHFAAVQLFEERARRAAPELQFDPDTLEQVTRICRLVEGMPLALELAVPWVRVMSVREIADELEHGLDLLSSSLRNLPDRHRSVRLVFDQSWQTLSTEEQAILARMSVFKNGCTREAAQKVAGARPACLMSLVDKALLRHRANRYEMHELVRQYAAEHLSQDPEALQTTLDLHHRFYLTLLAQVLPWLKGGRQLEGNHKITADIDNVRGAWSRAVDRRDREAIHAAAQAYWLYHEFIGQLAQGEAAFRAGVEAFNPAEDQALAGFLLAALGSMVGRQWRLEQGRALMQQGLSLLREAQPPDTEMSAFAMAWYAFLNVMSGAFDEAGSAAEESLACYPHTGDQWTQAGALRLVGAALLYKGQLQRAQAYLDECVEVCKSIGELRIRSYALSNLGVIHLWYGMLEEARRYFEESLRVSISCNDRLSRADSLLEYGRLFLASGEFDQAAETARVCMRINYELGRKKSILANIILGKALRLMHAEGAEEALMEGMEVARAVDQKPDIASGLEGLGSLALDQKKFDLAQTYFRESLEIWTEIGNEPEIATLCCRSAHGLMRSGSTDYARMRELFAQALHLARRHQAGTVAITALVGLVGVEISSGAVSADNAGRVASVLALAGRHPATPQEVRVWAGNLFNRMQSQGWQPEETPAQPISWQELAGEFDRVLNQVGG